MLRTHTHSGRSLLLPGALLIVWFLWASSGAQQSSSSVQEHFLAAQQDQQQGLLDQAAHEYQAVLRLQPGLAEAYINLGLIYYAQAKFEESAAALAIAGKLKPGMRGVSLWLGIDYVKLHRPAQGAALLREAIRQNPADKLAQSWLGTALWDAGQMDAALLQLGRACAQFPDDPDLLFARGEAYGKAATQQTEQLLEESSGTALSDLIYGTHYADERDWIKAEGHLRRAIERDPRSLDAHLELAAVLLEQTRLPAAREISERAVALAPQSASALARDGELLLLMQQPAEGLSRIQTALEIDRSEALDALGLPIEDRVGRNVTGNETGAEAGAELPPLCRKAAQKLEVDPTYSPAKDVALAALYALAGDEDDALHAYRRIGPVQSSPSPSASRFAKAVTAMHQHRYDDVETLLLSWLGTNPRDRMARYDLALVRHQISMAQVARLIEVAPDSYHVHQMLGQLYVGLTMANEASDGLQEDDKAIAEYLAVAAVRPDLPGVHFWLGHLYWKHGDADHALAELTRELKLDPGHPEANGELGAVLVAQGHVADAIPHLESAIRSMPDLWPAYLQLGRAYAIEKNYARAEEMLKRALTHDRDGSSHYQLGLVLRAEGKTAQAAQVFAQVKAIKNEKMAAPSADDAGNQGAKQ
jgi:tetratricopeptide (TPR) repeat protein